MMIFPQRNHYVAVVLTQRAVGQMLRIHGAIREATIVEDVIELFRRNLRANIVLNQIAQSRHFFNAHSWTATNMENKLSTIRIRKKVLTEPGQQQEDTKA